MTKIKLDVEGMHCNSCKILVKESLEEIGCSSVLIDLDDKKKIAKILLDYNGDKKDVVKVIESEGYKVK